MKMSELSGKRVHFVGISGTGMSAIANVLARRGVMVSGSDLSESSVFEALGSRGGRCAVGHHPSHIEGADLVVYSPAVPRDNCELEAARIRGLRVLSRAQMLVELVEGQDCIAVAGSHGKSTTTWLVGRMLLDAGLDPTILVGAHVGLLDGNSRDGQGQYLVAEVDESDGVFVDLCPALAIVTNIDREHLDFYRNLATIQGYFRRFLEHTGGKLGGIVCAEDGPAMEAARAAGISFLSYGFGEADIKGKILESGRSGSLFDVAWKGLTLGRFRTPLLGRHNVLNALAAFGVVLRLDLPLDAARTSLESNTGVDRRLSLRGVARNVSVLDDYGHHPTEIRATLEAFRPSVDGRLFVVFQPHRYSRTLYLYEEFGRSFSQADHLIVTNIYTANERPIEGVDARLIAEAARKEGHPSVEFIAEKQFVPPRLAQMVRPGDAILFQGAGDIYHLAKEMVTLLANPEESIAGRNAG